MVRDLEETFREPLQVTRYLPVVSLEEEPTFDIVVEPPGAPTGHLAKRPERVTVRPLHPQPPKGKDPYRPKARAPHRPLVRTTPAIEQQRQPRRVLPRAETNLNRSPERVDLSSLAMFWGFALAGSLAAIGIALTSW